MSSEDDDAIFSQTESDEDEVQIEVECERVEVCCASHSGNMLTSLMQLKCDGTMCDVTLKSGDFKVKAHRLVLASATEYFKAMFMNETKEAVTGIVDFSNMEPEVLRQCLRFIYSGEVEISKIAIKELIDASEMMQLAELSQLCTQFLVERIDLGNCAEVITLSCLYGKDLLHPPIKVFLSKHFSEFVESNDFAGFDFNSVAHCMNLLRDGSAESEVWIWNGILVWTQHDVEKRTCYFPKLFELVDLAFLSKAFLNENVLSHMFVKDSKECLRRIAAFYTQDSRVTNPKEIKGYFCYDKAGSQRMIQYDTKFQKWSTVPSFPGQFSSDTDVITYKNCVYVGDGVSLYWLQDGSWSRTETVVPTTERISKSERCYCKRWVYVTFTVPSVPDQKYCKCVGIGNSVYMVTGSRIYEFDIATMKPTRYNVSVNMDSGFFITASNRKIYIMGSMKTREFDITSKSCDSLQDMLEHTTRGLAVWYGGKVYAIYMADCCPAQHRVDFYDPETDVWVNLPELNIPWQPNSLFLGKKLYLIGETTEKGPKYHTIHLETLKVLRTNPKKQICVAATF